MKKSFMISKVIYLTWKNKYKNWVDAYPALKIGVPLTAAVLFCFLIVLAYQGIYPFIQSYGLDDYRMIPVLLAALFINLSLFAGLLLTIFLLISPERNTLEINLHWMPVSGFQRKIGYYIPLVLIVLTLLSVLYIPVLLAIGLGISLTPAQLVLLLFSMWLQILFVLLSTLILIEVYSFIFGYVLNLPYSRLFSLGLALLSLLGYFALNFKITMLQTLYENMSFNFLYISLVNVFSSIPGLYESRPLEIAAVNGLVLLLLALFLLTVFLPARLVEARGFALFKWLPFVKSPFASVIVKEVKENLRNRENLFYYILLFIFASLLLVFTNPVSYSGIIILLIFLLSSTQSFNSFGREREQFRYYLTLPYKLDYWIFGKLIGTLLFNLVLAGVLFLLFSIKVDFTVMSYFENMYIGILVSIALFLAGVILPYSPEQPYSTAFAAVIGSFLAIPMLYLMSKVMNVIPSDYYSISALGTCCVLLAVLKFILTWRRSGDFI
ncbi:hypothetical protein [Halobacillus sp. Marseille-Q1614]|uniref:hypothetical protein n=1 Tax=Halobacillus sp. Marseille-Q1614 TaxID=2709134 RepID=UPI00156E13C8|nr:hypothetical protein [Halobacillus sp. Marseille-Q1614]